MAGMQTYIPDVPAEARAQTEKVHIVSACHLEYHNISQDTYSHIFRLGICVEFGPTSIVPL